jgi:hypothetical protein
MRTTTSVSAFPLRFDTIVKCCKPIRPRPCDFSGNRRAQIDRFGFGGPCFGDDNEVGGGHEVVRGSEEPPIAIDGGRVFIVIGEANDDQRGYKTAEAADCEEREQSVHHNSPLNTRM